MSTTIYKTKLHAAKAFSRRYLESLGGGWFRIGNRKIQGLNEVYTWMEKKKYALPWCDGRVEMVFEILDSVVLARAVKS